MGYSRFDRPIQSTQRFMTMGGIPVTMTIIAINVVLFLIDNSTKGSLIPYFACSMQAGHVLALWTLVAYPLLTPDFLGLVFGAIWLFGIGGSLERSWGRGRYSLFFILVSLASSLGILLGTKLIPLGAAFPLIGLWVPLAAVTVAWAAIDPYQEIMFYFVLKLQARWVAFISVGVIYFEYFKYQPLLGFFGLLGCVLAYYWVRGRVPYAVRSAFDGFGRSRKRSRGPDLRFTDVDRVKGRGTDLEGKSKGGLLGAYRSYQQRKKLEKLWKASGLGDDDNPIGRGR